MNKIFYVAVFDGGQTSKHYETMTEARECASNMLANNARMTKAYVMQAISLIERDSPPIREVFLK
jgi:hypothetical protein